MEEACITAGSAAARPASMLRALRSRLAHHLASYSYNPSPDFIGKLAFQPGFGHYEILGIVSHFRDRIFPNAGAPTPTAAGAYNNSTWVGGLRRERPLVLLPEAS